MTFEVGKKYNKYSNYIYECKYVGETTSFLEAPGFTATPRNHMDNNQWGWKEYKEPVIEKKILYARTNSFNELYTSNQEHPSDYVIKHLGVKSLGCIEFTITDGELTGVEIVK